MRMRWDPTPTANVSLRTARSFLSIAFRRRLGCATMEHYSAVGVSIISALLYHVSYRGFLCMRIDDAISAGAVHFVCGAWGLIAAGFTGTEDARLEAGYRPQSSCSRAEQSLANVVMTIIILVYVRRMFRQRMRNQTASVSIQYSCVNRRTRWTSLQNVD